MSSVSPPAILASVRSCIAEVCGVADSAVTDDGKLIGYGLDSIRSLELLLVLEERLGLELNETDPHLAKIETVRQLADFVSRARDSG